MKTLTSAFLAFSILFAGCATKQPPGRVALNATESVMDTVQASMDAWFAWVAIREAQIAELKKTDRGAALEQSTELLKLEGRVLSARASYQEAAKIAIAAGAASTGGEGTSERVAAAAAQLINLISTLTQK